MSTILEQRHILARSPHRSLWGEAWTHRQGIVGSFLLFVFAFMAIFGPLLAPHDPIAIDLGNPFAEPAWLDLENGAGIMGTDNLGRDVFSRVLVGSRISLLIGTSATIIGLVTGIVMGLIAGYRGGLAGDIIMRVADTQTAIPFLVLLIAAVAFIGGGFSTSSSSSASAPGSAMPASSAARCSASASATSSTPPAPSAPVICASCSATSCPTQSHPSSSPPPSPSAP